MADLGNVSVLNINGNTATIKDPVLTGIVNEIITAIGANNSNIAERINDLHRRSFDNVVEVVNNSETILNNLTDNLYKVNYGTKVDPSDTEEALSITDTRILFNQSDKQVEFYDNHLRYRTKTNDTWGNWTIVDLLGLENVVSTTANQGLDNLQQANARANIGAGTSSFSGAYNDLSGKPSIPSKTSDLTNDSNFATTSEVQTAVSNLVNSAPTTLDTLNELAAALGNDPNFATTITTQIGNKLSYSTVESNAGNVGDGAYTNITSGRTNWINSSNSGALISLGNLQLSIDSGGRLYSRIKGDNPWNLTNQLKTINDQTPNLNEIYEPSIIGYRICTNAPTQDRYTVFTFTSSDLDDNGYRSILQLAINRDNGNPYIRWAFKQITNGNDYITTNWELLKNTVTSVNGNTGDVTITKSSVGLGNVDNTSDINKPISNATQTALNSKANNTLSNSYITPTKVQELVSPTAGDTIEESIQKLNNGIVNDEALWASALNDLNTRITNLQNNISLSVDYSAASGTNNELIPTSGDSMQTAISKLHKSVIDLENMYASLYNDLNTRLTALES